MNKDEQTRISIIKKASWIGILGNALLAILKLVLGFISGSLAVIADGIDSASDIVTSFITLFAANIIASPPDKEHPWGHSRAETIATKTLSFIIFFAGAQLGFSTIKNLITQEISDLPTPLAVYVTLLSIVGKIFLAIYKHKAGQKADSPMLKADALNMKNDIFLSLAVLLGLGFTYIFKLPLIDTLTGLLLSLWIMKSGFDLFIETSLELMDSVDDPEIYNKVFDAAEQTPGVLNPHRARIRKLNNLYDIDLDIEVDANLSVYNAHEIAQKVEGEIKKRIPHIFDIMVHVEPYGNVEENEQFGLSRKSLMDTND